MAVVNAIIYLVEKKTFANGTSTKQQFDADEKGLLGTEKRQFDTKEAYLILEKINTIMKSSNFQTLVRDISLFVILQTFSRLFYICLKPQIFHIPSENNQQEP